MMQYQTALSLQNTPRQAFLTPARASSTTSSRGGGSSASSGGDSSTGGRSAKGGKLSHRQRMAANQRERRRMTSLNTAFDVLRRCLPEGRAKEINTKKPVSKVETLHLAIDYIANLQKELLDYDSEIGYPPSLVPVQGQLVRQLPDEAQLRNACFPDHNSISPEMSTAKTPNSGYPGGLTTPPVYCFGGMVQHSQNNNSNNRNAPSSTSSTSSRCSQTMIQNIVPIAPDQKFNFQFINNCCQQNDSRQTAAMIYGNAGYLTPASSSSSYSSPQPPCSFTPAASFAPTAALGWYC